MTVTTTKLPGVLILEPKVFGDERGFFLETFHAERYREAGLPLPFVQDNHSRSRKGVLRGLHAQGTHPQGKLVGVTRGRVFDVAADARVGSPTFGQWVGVELDDESHRQLYIPPGYLHGFCVLSEVADFVYKCTDVYHPNDEIGIRWDDPTFAIDWPIADPIVSAKDRALRFL
ncbi:MAG: dTDP-4-dehydrorhamnose 3,5-epimerase [Bacteroidota bacterium]